MIYLNILADALEQQGKTGLDSRWVVTLIGGSGKLSVFVTLLGANKIKTAQLIDSSTNGAQAVRRLRDNNQLHKGGLLEISQFTGTANADIEDLFETDFYLELVNRAYAKHLTAPHHRGRPEQPRPAGRSTRGGPLQEQQHRRRSFQPLQAGRCPVPGATDLHRSAPLRSPRPKTSSPA